MRLGVVFFNIVSLMPTSYRMAYGFIALEMLLLPYVYSYCRGDRKYVQCYVFVLVLFWFYRLEDTVKDAMLDYSSNSNLLGLFL